MMRTLALCILLSSPTASSAQIAADYLLDDGTATDVSGNGNDGTVFGSPVLVAGVEGRALRFASSDRIRVGDDPTLQSSAPYISAWFQRETAADNGGILVQKRAGSQGYRLSVLPGGSVRFEVFDATGVSQITSPFPVLPGVWTSVVGTFDGSSLSLYVHGTLAAESAGPARSVATTAPLEIGRRFTGLIDHVQIGSGPLASSQACVQALKVWHEASATCLDAMVEEAAAQGIADLETRTFGATLVDIDEDGWLDLYYVNGNGNPAIPPSPTGVCGPLPDPIPWVAGSANTLHMNSGSGSFLPDSAPDVGLDDKWNAMRHVWADYDNSGSRHVFSHNFLHSTLYRMVQGPEPMIFEDYNEQSGLDICLEAGTGASWVDLDLDGFLDLYLVEYDPSRPGSEHLNVLYMNDGFGSFVEVTQQAGLSAPANPMGVAFGDYDNDGDQDFFQTNSHEVASRLYRHQGVDQGTGVPQFEDVAVEAGVAVIGEPNRGIGASWGDYNNDGRLDLLFSREQDSRLFRNDGPDGEGVWRFTDVTGLAGLDLAGFGFWGGGFADLDNDGWLDVMLTNRSNGANQVFLSNRGQSWREVSSTLGMELDQLPQMGFVAGDVDNDGDLDVITITHGTDIGRPNAFWRNQARGNNWVQFRLTGTRSNRDAVGARIEISSALQPGESMTRQIREIAAGTGFFSDFPRIQSFGLGRGTQVQRVRIFWPSGLVENLGPFDANQRYDFVEPLP